MNSLTEKFLRLILEEENPKKEEKPKPKPKPEKKEGKPEGKKEEKKEDLSLDKFKKISGTTSNKLSLGKPIADAGLSGMKDRATDPTEAAKLLKELGLGGIGGSNVYEYLLNLYSKAAGSDMDVLIGGAELVQDINKTPGVQINLKGVWNQDDKGGKRSYGYIRSLLIAAMNTGTISIPARQKRALRIEMLDGTSNLVAYVGKSKSWGVEK